MPDLIISESGGLISAEIKARKEIYYLVTSDNLQGLKGKSILTDIFVVIASILWGGFTSTVITASASSNLAAATTQILRTYQTVFLIAAVLFTLLAIVFLFVTYIGIENIKKSTLDVHLQP